MAKLAHNNIYFFLIVIIYSIFIFSYDFTQSRDFDNYTDWYYFTVENDIGSYLAIKDPMFFILSKISHFFSVGVIGVVVFYILVSLWAKLKILSVLNVSASVFILFFVFYFCRFFILLEGTQFRAAVAVPLATLGVIYYLHGCKRSALFLFSVSVFFHLSALVIFLFLILSHIISKSKKSIAMIIYLSMLFFSIFFKFDMSILLSFPFLGDRIADYINGDYEVTALSLFNTYLFFKVILFTIIFSSCSLIYDEKMFVFASMSFFGMLLFVFFREIDSFALRLHELFALFDALLFAYATRAFNQKSRFLYVAVSLPLLAIFLNSSLSVLNINAN